VEKRTCVVKQARGNRRGIKAESKPERVQNTKAIAVIPKKEESQKTLVEIIEDARSGLPSKSEVEKSQQKEALKKLGLATSLGSKTVT
jgi:hypothetical protein